MHVGQEGLLRHIKQKTNKNTAPQEAKQDVLIHLYYFMYPGCLFLHLYFCKAQVFTQGSGKTAGKLWVLCI